VAKARTRKPAKKTTKKPKPKAPVRKAPEVWICIVDGWVRYHGKRYAKGDTILVDTDKMSYKDLDTLRKYFELKPTEIMSGISEPVELLDEGDNHGSHSN